MSSYDRQRSRSRDRYDADHKGSQDYYNDRNYDHQSARTLAIMVGIAVRHLKRKIEALPIMELFAMIMTTITTVEIIMEEAMAAETTDDRRDGGDHYGKKRGRSPPPSVSQSDDKLPVLKDDPRINADGVKEGGKAVKAKGGGRNTESFDPRSTLVRPSMRVVVGPNKPVYDKKLKHDDVVIVPEFFCKEDDWSLYYKLVEEMREVQQAEHNPDNKGSEWISWHEGAHLISKNPKGSATYNAIQAKISTYFGIENDKVGTRFNWYRDSSDWKPFHHDSAAFNPQRAKNQEHHRRGLFRGHT